MHGSTSQITQISYTGYPQITFSDHRPVASDFYVDVCVGHWLFRFDPGLIFGCTVRFLQC
jgi:hypothetical protein